MTGQELPPVRFVTEEPLVHQVGCTPVLVCMDGWVTCASCDRRVPGRIERQDGGP